MKVVGTAEHWMPVDLRELALALAELRRLTPPRVEVAPRPARPARRTD